MIEQSARRSKEAEAANDKAHAKFESDLKRWAALGVKETRQHRKRMAEHDKRIAKLDRESAGYRRRTDQNRAEITDKLNGLIGYIDVQHKPQQ